MTSKSSVLSQTLPRLVLGGAGFSFQTHPDPESLPIVDIVKQAFDRGLLAIDTSPFYEPSEQLLGHALAQPQITSCYTRSDYILMTKVGRTGPDTYDYSPAWVRKSVTRSLKRLGTSYLDVVFCHDIEAVTDQDVLDAVGELLSFVQQGIVKLIGLSSYRIDLLSQRALLVRERFGRPVDVVQNWGQLTLQNSLLESQALEDFKNAGVSHIFSSSPLGIGLLRRGGVPQGKFGDFHPAPEGLRAASRELSSYIDTQGENLASVALRYSVWRAQVAAQHHGLAISTITGISTPAELLENVNTVEKLLQGDLRNPTINLAQVEVDKPLFDKARSILGDWVNWTYTIPAEGWDPQLKCNVKQDA
ncbi:Aldo/keto reductase family-domain-containing protein [Xylogone sp. PMI_703]|nr:Aldo/keto reductase family-domain-containing protein [Xylogone sp. PMI_703]